MTSNGPHPILVGFDWESGKDVVISGLEVDGLLIVFECLPWDQQPGRAA